VANALISGHSWTEGVNWHEAQKVGLALLVSPIFGFVCSALLLLLLKATISNPALFTAPEKDKTPPTWIRAILILTCTGVSFGHGRNDGQKGMGLIVLILVGLMPINYALRMDAPSDEVKGIAAQAQVVQPILAKGAGAATVTATEAKTELENYTKEGAVTEKAYAAMAFQSQLIHDSLASANSFGDLSPEKRTELRKNIFLENNAITKLTKTNVLKEPADNAAVTKFGKDLTGITNFIPLWVKIAVAFALGLGTMIGWKRIVVTVGEKIGKSHLTYGQGAAAELVAAATIIAADNFGMPVSTTHVLSSGVAGTMAANGSGLQAQTLRNILLAWVLTLPVCMILGSALFAFANNILLSWLGLK